MVVPAAGDRELTEQVAHPFSTQRLVVRLEPWTDRLVPDDATGTLASQTWRTLRANHVPGDLRL